MAKKTVINRACKTPINSSTDAFLMEDEYEAKETKTEDVKHEIVNETATEEITFELQQPQDNPAITPSLDF
jgi:recombinational DNA repair protein RecT